MTAGSGFLATGAGTASTWPDGGLVGHYMATIRPLNCTLVLQLGFPAGVRPSASGAVAAGSVMRACRWLLPGGMPAGPGDGR